MKASLVGEFEGLSSSSDAIKVLDFDYARNLDSSGKEKTSFYPGEPIYLYLHLSSYVSVVNALVTEGQIRSDGKSSRQVTTRQFFTSREEDKPTVLNSSVCPTNSSKKFFGNRKGSPTVTVNQNGSWSCTAMDFAKVPYLVDYTFDFDVQLYTYIPPALLTVAEDEVYPIGIVFYLKETI